MEFSVDQQYRLNRQVLSFYGLWPYHSQTTKIRIKQIFSILFLIYATVVQAVRIFMTELTTDFILDCLPIVIPSLGAVVQFLNRIIINDRLKDLFDQIKIDWKCARSQDEIEIMQTNIINTRLTSKVFLRK
ncbi:uncharacterized protein LOC120357947 [Solenopsis invicta]|uniref:uncharacterized protein LOC120357947 n=1 Tax=Solenopsis invicta TaxID=13686 RepID=UPI00193D568A|nr:uncharacterized protein LOC120357947 [Solenopsis invicta]